MAFNTDPHLGEPLRKPPHMPTITLSKAVGKGAIGSTVADIKTVQILLTDKKDRSGKKLYQGRIDGKAGPKTVAGITCLQSLNSIKETPGLIRPNSATMNKLRFGASPSALKQIAAETVGEDGAATPAAKHLTVRAASAIRRSAPFPDSYAYSLEDLVKALGQRGIPLKLVQGDISQDGRWMAIMKVEKSSLGSGLTENELNKKASRCLSEILSTTKAWKLEKAGSATLVSTQAYAKLANLDDPSNTFLDEMGVTPGTLSAAQKKLMAAVEKLSSVGEF